MADHAGDLGVDQLLRDGGPDLRIGLVVLTDEYELHSLAVDLHALGIRFLDCEARAVLVVLAEVGDASGERPHVADAHVGSAAAAAAARGSAFLVAALLSTTNQ
jgi:hypothetical protein